jgi:KamA family protein
VPERIDDGLLTVFESSRLPWIVVVHANHPQELDDRFALAMSRLRQGRVTLLNQTVLLRGVNDNREVLVNLSERLFACGVLPYYLHLLDRVAGVGHFDVAESVAKTLLAECQAALPGFLVPRLIREQPGAPSKTWVGC